jgi:predicted nucleic acid-binding protein
MGLNRKQVYFDACIVIYLIERAAGFVERVETAIMRASDIQVCVSPLVEMECMVGVLKRQDSELRRAYEEFFNACVMLDIQADTFRLAGELRAKYGIKTPDALHLATATQHGCGQFWTNDERLNKAAGNILVTAFS